MTITANSLGQNSSALSYTAGTTEPELSNAVKTAFSSMGWEIFDEISETRTILRALTKDGNSYKFADIDIRSNYVYLAAWEDWDAALSQGTNQTYYGTTSTYMQRYNLTNGGDLFLFGSARHMIILSRIAGDNWGNVDDSSFTAVLEVARDNPEEIAGEFPLFVWTTGKHFIGGHAISGNRARCAILPRDSAGYTDSYAWDYLGIATVVGSTHDNAAQLYNVLPSGSNPMSPTGATQVYTPYLVDRRTKFVRGRVYGLKILPLQIGSVMDKINVRVNNELFYDANGSFTLYHHVLSTNTANGRFAIPE